MSDSGRRIILDLAITLDGFIEGKSGETDWCIMDPEMNFLDFLDEIDTIFYGRRSYEAWGHHQPAEDDSIHEGELWRRVHSKEKVVFSTSMDATDSKDQVIGHDLYEEIMKIKSRPGKSIWLYGGSSLISTFMGLDLIDEFRLSVHPILLGEGKPLFSSIPERLHLHLAGARTFSSGVVQLVYHRRFQGE